MTIKNMVLWLSVLLLVLLFVVFFFFVKVNIELLFIMLVFVIFIVIIIYIYATKKDDNKSDDIASVEYVKQYWKSMANEELNWLNSKITRLYSVDIPFFGFTMQRKEGLRAGKKISFVVTKDKGKFTVAGVSEIPTIEIEENPIKLLGVDMKFFSPTPMTSEQAARIIYGHKPVPAAQTNVNISKDETDDEEEIKKIAGGTTG